MQEILGTPNPALKIGYFMVFRYSDRAGFGVSLSDLYQIGISQLKGGKNYGAVLVNIETGKPIALLKNRNKETIVEYLNSLGKETLEQIEEVSIDLWIGYKSVVEEMLPNAQIVGDRFHVMKLINEELDSRRKQEKREARHFIS